MRANIFGLALSLVCGLSGALLAQTIGLPSAWLLGSMSTSGFAALLRWPVKFPLWLQNVMIIMIALNIGGTLDTEALPALWHWLPSLLGMLLSLWLTFLTMSWLLRRHGDFDKNAAFLAAYPGHLVLVLQAAQDITSDLHRITIIQSLRVLTLAVILPAALHGLPINEVSFHEVQTDWKAMPVVAVAAMCGAVAASLARLPASMMIGAIVGAMAASFAGFSFGRLPVQAEYALLLFTGTMIGTQFVNSNVRTLISILPVFLLAIMLSLLISALTAIPISIIINVPFSQLLLAYAPGGADVMSIIALTTGYDASFVGLHHVVRLIFLGMALPFLLQVSR